MKIRTGFVSNSSSSSFVLGLEGDAEVTMSIKVDLAQFGEVAETQADLDAYFVREYVDEWGDSLVEVLAKEEWLRERYITARAHINIGKKVLLGEVCTDSDSPIECFFCERGFPECDDYVVIQQTGW